MTRWITSYIFLLIWTPLAGQVPGTITIETSFSKFVKRLDEPKYQKAAISYELDGEIVTKPIRLRARGNFRRQHCELPPVRIQFVADNYGIPLFDEQDKLKLVNECDFETGSQQLLRKEYLVYRMYRELTENAFNTYFFKIEFVNTDSLTDRFTSYGFLVEDIDHLASRIGGSELEQEGLKHEDLDTSAELLVSFFAFMIGNTDWYVKNLHNLKLVQPGDSTKAPIPIPYDFDFSGFVNADYAYPGKSVPIKNVRQRYFMGQCNDKSVYETYYQKFESKRDVFNQIITSDHILTKTSKEDALNYQNEFFTILDDPKGRHKKIYKKCWK